LPLLKFQPSYIKIRTTTTLLPQNTQYYLTQSAYCFKISHQPSFKGYKRLLMSFPHRISRFHHIITVCGTALLKGNYKMSITSFVKVVRWLKTQNGK